MYDPKSMRADDFICHEEILASLEYAERFKNDKAALRAVLNKAEGRKGLDHRETALLLLTPDREIEAELFALARRIKQEFYGNRIVMFAPLYLSNHCLNSCVYCPYHRSNADMPRIKLGPKDIERETSALQDMGHKRLALEAGEHPKLNPIEYILEAVDIIYSVKRKNGAIRRVNVNIAATTVENYKKLRDAKIGTYILFQETYNKAGYVKLHPAGPKHDYARQTEAMDRAMEGGIDDVGLGVLFGLQDYRYELVALLMHAEHLEAAHGVGPHTVSVPRIRAADGIDLDAFTSGVKDDEFARLIACIRVAAPYVGMIVSTRESKACRERVLDLGVSQISGGSRTSVGGYCEPEPETELSAQFKVNDNRSLDEVVAWLMRLGHLPSFCTACYREGRTGDRFMALCKAGQILNCCHPNALLTLKEYLTDYAGPESRTLGEPLIAAELSKIPSEKIRTLVAGRLKDIENGSRDFRV
ncbi:MAG: [FeFe] hydrogenase H-cluster radical SAM maturase HydG [Desulfovibrio sp.]|nr:[FeFe] hydrogenase H-cluster radical SAM maturase HydG [Desulfovibrio sp.]